MLHFGLDWRSLFGLKHWIQNQTCITPTGTLCCFRHRERADGNCKSVIKNAVPGYRMNINWEFHHSSLLSVMTVYTIWCVSSSCLNKTAKTFSKRQKPAKCHKRLLLMQLFRDVFLFFCQLHQKYSDCQTGLVRPYL